MINNIFYAQNQLWGDSVGIYWKRYDLDTKTSSMASEVVFNEVEEGVDHPPSFSLSNTDAQQLMDNLWQCGLRPTESRGSAGAMDAVQKHLEDMRKLVFKQEECHYEH